MFYLWQTKYVFKRVKIPNDLSLIIENSLIEIILLQNKSIYCFYMWCFAQFGTICTIQKKKKKGKTSMEECYFYRLQPETLLKVTLLHGCFWRFSNCTNSTKSRKACHMTGTLTLNALTYFKSIFHFFFFFFFSIFHFYTPWKTRKLLVFWHFQGV